jgi:hypothetical protein
MHDQIRRMIAQMSGVLTVRVILWTLSALGQEDGRRRLFRSQIASNRRMANVVMSVPNRREKQMRL